jgi:hypothetical protein
MLKAIRGHLLIPVVFALSPSGVAADHGDALPAAVAVAPSSEVADLYAWMSNDTSKLNLVLTVSPDAEADSWFSSDVAYAFSISSSMAIGEPGSVTTIACQFVDDARIECWAGDDYLIGDPRAASGIWSDAGSLRVFAGRRNDPFFLAPDGIDAALEALRSGVEQEAFEFRNRDSGCPRLTQAQGEQLRALLASGESGASPSDTFAGQSVLALVLQVDRSVLDASGPILGVWAGSYAGARR